MDIDVQALGGFEHEGALHEIFPDGGGECDIFFFGGGGAGVDFAEFGFVVGVFVGIIIPWNPKGGMVAGHFEGRPFIIEDEVVQVILFRKSISKTDTIVVDAELHLDGYAGISSIFELDAQGGVLVANVFYLTE